MKKQAVHTLKSILARTEDYGDCQLWTGYARNGTPQIDYYGRMTAVRKVIAILQGREIKEGGFWATDCGTPLCVCPAHIIQRSKVAHMRAAARAANVGATAIQRTLKVTMTRRAQSGKLTLEKAREIRASDEPNPVLAARYGVHRSLISHVRTGKSWKDTASPFAGLLA